MTLYGKDEAADLSKDEKAQLRKVLEAERAVVLKARQLGMTTWVSGRFLLKTITQPGTLTLQVAHTQESAEELLRMVHRFVEHLPAGLQRGVLRTGRANVRQIVFPEIDSEYRVESAANPNAGRGLTVQNMHCSEVSRWAGDATDTLAGLRAALAPGGELVLESTPNGAGGCFYEEWRRAPETGVVQHFFPWWMEAGYRSAVAAEGLTEEERELVAREGLDLRQIGYRRQMRASLREMAGQEMAEDAESCFLASGEMYFDREAVEARLREVPEAAGREWGGKLVWWLPYQAGRRYLVAVDPAGGGADGDNSAMEVLDVETGMQCAEYAGHVEMRELAEHGKRLAERYGNALMVVERNNHGSGVLAMLTEHLGYGNVYVGSDGRAGWLTTAASRPRMVGGLAAAQTVPVFALVEEMGFGIDLLAWAPDGEPGEAARRLAARPGVRGLSLFQDAEGLKSLLAGGAFRAVYTAIAHDHRVTEAGKAQFSMRLFEPGLAGAARTLERLLDAARLPFFERYARRLATVERDRDA